jgi:hypothetical protein
MKTSTLRSLVLIAGLGSAMLTQLAIAQTAITSYTIDGGGGTSTGGIYSLSGTIGQADATMAGELFEGPYALTGGYWGGAGAATCRADFDHDGFVTGLDFDLYVQAFELGDPTADFDLDGFITGLDFDLYVQAFEAGC